MLKRCSVQFHCIFCVYEKCTKHLVCYGGELVQSFRTDLLVACARCLDALDIAIIGRHPLSTNVLRTPGYVGFC